MAIEIMPAEAEQLDRFIREESAAEYSRILRENPGMMFHMVLWNGGIKIEVFADEHPPPHFRLKHQGRTANFAIADCRKLNGNLQLPDRAVRKWWQEHRWRIAECWNLYRPADCTVGRIDVAALGW